MPRGRLFCRPPLPLPAAALHEVFAAYCCIGEAGGSRGLKLGDAVGVRDGVGGDGSRDRSRGVPAALVTVLAASLAVQLPVGERGTKAGSTSKGFGRLATSARSECTHATVHWAMTSGLYPPSRTRKIRSSQKTRARRKRQRVIQPNASGETRHSPSGSPLAASKPAETRIASGRKRSRRGQITCCMTCAMSRSENPFSKGIFTLYPRAWALPASSRNP